MHLLRLLITILFVRNVVLSNFHNLQTTRNQRDGKYTEPDPVTL